MTNMDVDRMEQRIIELAKSRPVYYYDILNEFMNEDYRIIMLAFGQIRQKKIFGRDSLGRYIVESKTERE
jgi:hypothetical protein